MPKWVECNGDPSGRILSVFKSDETKKPLSIKQREQIEGYLRST